jgi:hypothetical protein
MKSKKEVMSNKVKKQISMISTEVQKAHAKKIANEPSLLSKWLLERSQLEFDPELSELFEQISGFINEDSARNQEAVEARARRKAHVGSYQRHETVQR